MLYTVLHPFIFDFPKPILKSYPQNSIQASHFSYSESSNNGLGNVFFFKFRVEYFSKRDSGYRYKGVSDIFVTLWNSLIQYYFLRAIADILNFYVRDSNFELVPWIFGQCPTHHYPKVDYTSSCVWILLEVGDMFNVFAIQNSKYLKCCHMYLRTFMHNNV